LTRAAADLMIALRPSLTTVLTTTAFTPACRRACSAPGGAPPARRARGWSW
jgi:hypothetical protein